MHGQHQHLAFRGVRQRLPGDIHPVQPGHRHHIAEHWPIRDAQERASREDHRRVSKCRAGQGVDDAGNGGSYLGGLCGYCQRVVKKAALRLRGFIDFENSYDIKPYRPRNQRANHL
jgi:hypothetical protein